VVVAGVAGIVEVFSPVDDNVAVQIEACVTLAVVGVGVGL